jgi:hypothetical protein
MLTSRRGNGASKGKERAKAEPSGASEAEQRVQAT